MCRRKLWRQVFLSVGEPKGRLLFWGSRRIWQEGSGTKITHRGGPTGKYGRVLAYRGLKKALEMGTFLHRGSVKNHGRSIHWEL
jgi:hypothetical protein